MQKRSMKVSYLGETKRIKATNSYEALALQTRETFKNGLEKVWPIRFYYLDEDNELISITSQTDFQEALDDFVNLKLIVANNVSEARDQLSQLLNESASLSMSLQQSAFMRQSIQNLNDQSHANQTIMRPFDMCDGGITDRSVTQQMIDELGHPARQPVLVPQTERLPSVPVHRPPQTTQQSVPPPLPPVKDDKDESMSSAEDEECIEEETVDCFKCDGKKVNKKGQECKKCNGTGLFSFKGSESLVKAVRDEISVFATDQFKTMFKNFQETRRANEKIEVHQGFICDGCKANPIKGIRYMCSVCHDYDICEVCERQGVHSEHNLLKIRRATQAPANFVCKYAQPSEPPKQEIVEPAQQVQQSQKPCKNKRFQGRFVKESFSDKHPVEPGQSFTKQWTIRNAGEIAWPDNVMFIQTSGDDMASVPVTVTRVVQPEEEYVFEMSLKAPMKPGRYISYFRMQVGQSTLRFGHKVWCDIQVLEPLAPPKEVMVVPDSANQQLMDSVNRAINEPNCLATSFEMPKEEADKDQKFDLNKSVVLQNVVTPKQAYNKKVDEADKKYQENLKQIYEIGLVDFDSNMAALIQHDNNVEAALNQLFGAY